MTYEEIKETLDDYNQLSAKQKESAFFRYYASCKSTHYCQDFEPIRTWFSTNMHQTEEFLTSVTHLVPKTPVKKQTMMLCG